MCTIDSLPVLIISLPRRYITRKGKRTKAKTIEIKLATMMSPMLNNTKNQQRSVADIFAIQMMKTI